MTAGGGHWFDTGGGPQPVSVASGLVQDERARAAYQEYLDHKPGCEQCQQSVFICPDAAALWEAYKATRGPE